MVGGCILQPVSPIWNIVSLSTPSLCVLVLKTKALELYDNGTRCTMKTVQHLNSAWQIVSTEYILVIISITSLKPLFWKIYSSFSLECVEHSASANFPQTF